MVKKTTKQETATTIIVDEDELAATSETEDQTYKDLIDKLAKTRKDKRVIGYILRNTTSATIDLDEPEKIVEYALFSSQVLDSSQVISELYELGEVESTLVEGKEKSALCMTINGNKISIFMKKAVDHAEIMKRISP